MPAGWAFDRVLELTAGELEGKDAALADALLKARTEVTGGYCDLRKLETEKFRLLVEGVERALARVEGSGPTAFHNPSFYPGFLARFRDLKALLSADPRARGRGI